MKTFYWLLKREFWEHRGAFLWAPVITAGAVIILNIASLIAASISGADWGINILWSQIAAASPGHPSELGSVLTFSALVPMAIVSIVLFLMLFGYCMKNLTNDRADRSILFWKSLPVSDLGTVLSKAVSAMVVAPVIALIVGLVSAVLMMFTLAVAGSMHGINFGQVFWTIPHLGQVLFYMVAMLPVYLVWMLPTVGWLMLCSALSGSRMRTRRWAIALPAAITAVLYWLSLIGPIYGAGTWFLKHVLLRVFLGLLPGGWNSLMNTKQIPQLQIFRSHDAGTNAVTTHIQSSQLVPDMISHSYHMLLTPDFLWGVLVGVIMLGLAVWLRRWRTEL
ncbi:MAG TPA: hypothetical protein VF271_06450 [Rhodanobacteraceae bacterium]